LGKGEKIITTATNCATALVQGKKDREEIKRGRTEKILIGEELGEKGTI